MRKALLIIAIVVLVLVPIAAYALVVNTPARADVRAYYNGSADRQELTQKQQADLQESHQNRKIRPGYLMLIIAAITR